MKIDELKKLRYDREVMLDVVRRPDNRRGRSGVAPKHSPCQNRGKGLRAHDSDSRALCAHMHLSTWPQARNLISIFLDLPLTGQANVRFHRHARTSLLSSA
jgi:hypothetical protein